MTFYVNFILLVLLVKILKQVRPGVTVLLLGGRYSVASASPSPGPSTIIQDRTLYISTPGSSSVVIESPESYQSSFSPSSMEVSSVLAVHNNGVDHLEWDDEFGAFSRSNNDEVGQAL